MLSDRKANARALTGGSERWSGQRLGALLGLALLAVPDHAQAQQVDLPAPVEAALEIEQAPGSEHCPDKEAVFRSIKRLFPEREFRLSSDKSSRTATARVSIRPLPPGHQAVLTLLPPRQGQRVIHEHEEDCRGLADALALAFVMLVAPPDPETEPELAGNAPPGRAAADSPATGTAAPPSKPAEPETSVREAERAAPAASAARSYRAGIGASLVGGLGLLSEPALGGAGEIELFHQSGFGLSLQGLRLWSLPAEAEGGSVTLTLWGLLVAPCYRLRVSVAAGLDACLRLGIGSQHAEVKEFLSPQSGSYPWLVLVPQIGYRQGLPGLGELLSGFVRIGLVGQLRPQSFSVRLADGSGETLQIASAPKFGVMADIGLIFGTRLF
jgi:hypothetical protein